jgi:hypothetical protein
LEFKAPAGEKLCTTTFVRICVSRDEAAERVHAELERVIRREAPALLSELDARIEKQVDLRAFVSQALAVLAAPSGADGLALPVEQLALGPIDGKQTRLRMNAELALRVVEGPVSEPPKLPPKGELTKSPSELNYDVTLPFSELGERFSAQLAGKQLNGWSLARCEALGFARGGLNLVLSLKLQRGEQQLTVFADGALAQKNAELSLSQLTWSPASHSALVSMGLPAEDLTTMMRQAARLRLEEYAQDRLTQIERKLAVLTLALTPISLVLKDAHYEAWRPASGALRFRVQARPSVKLQKP